MTSPGRSERVSVAASIVSRHRAGEAQRQAPRQRAAGQFERDVEAAGARLDVHARHHQIGGRRRLDMQHADVAIEDDGEVLRVAEAELAGERARDAVGDVLGGDARATAASR